MRVDTVPLSNYEQPLPIREHDGEPDSGAWHRDAHQQDKQKSHFIKSNLNYKNVYVLKKDSYAKLIFSIAQKH